MPLMIWWCEEHDSSAPFDDDIPSECYACPYTSEGIPETLCRFVQKLLVDA